MPRNTTTYRLGDERDRVDEQLDDLADRAAECQDDTEYKGIAEDAKEAEKDLVGLQYLVDEYGADAEAVVGGLTTGEYAQLTDRVADAQAQQVGGGSMTGAGRVFFVALGLVDAPFINDGAGFEETVVAVRELPPQTSEWLESAVDEATIPSDPGNSFAERVQARSDQPTNSDSPAQH